VKPIHFLTVLWGNAYTQTYLNVSLPAQLAPGNLPAVGMVPGSIYKIYTTSIDARTLEADPRIAEAKRHIHVQIIVFAPTAEGLRFESSMEQFAVGVDAAQATGAMISILSPDAVFADGAFAAIHRLHASGKRLIMTAAPRTRLAALPGALRQAVVPDAHGALTIPPRVLMQVALEHLHPITEALFWDNPNFSSRPSILYWWVRRNAPRAVLAHCFHLHPILVDPADRNIKLTDSADGEFIHGVCPDPRTHHIVTDSDELACVEMSGDSHEHGLNHPGGASMENVFRWSQWSCNPTHLRFFKHPILLHAGPVPAQSEISPEARLVVKTLAARLSALHRELLRPRWERYIRSWQGWLTENSWTYCRPRWLADTGMNFPLNACCPSDLIVVEGRLTADLPVELKASFHRDVLDEKKVSRGGFLWTFPARAAYCPVLQITANPPVSRELLFIGSIRIWRTVWHKLQHDYRAGRADPVWLEWQGLGPGYELSGPCNVRIRHPRGIVSLTIETQAMDMQLVPGPIQTHTLPLDLEHPERPVSVNLKGRHRVLAISCRETAFRRAQKELAQIPHFLFTSLFTSAGRQRLARRLGWTR